MQQPYKQAECPDHNQNIKFICIKKGKNIFACLDCLQKNPNCIPFIPIKQIQDSFKQQQIEINQYLIDSNLPDISQEKIDSMASNLKSQMKDIANFFSQIKEELKTHLQMKETEIVQKFNQCQDTQQKLSKVLSEVNSVCNSLEFRKELLGQINRLNQESQTDVSTQIKNSLKKLENIYKSKLSSINDLYSQYEADSDNLIPANYKKQIIEQLANKFQYQEFQNLPPAYNFEISKFEQSDSIIKENDYVFQNVVGKHTQAIIGSKSFSSGTHSLVIQLIKKPSDHFYLSLCDNIKRSTEPIWGCLNCNDTHFDNSNFIDLLKDGSKVKMIMDFEKDTASIIDLESQKTAKLTAKALSKFKDLRFAITWCGCSTVTPVKILYCD